MGFYSLGTDEEGMTAFEKPSILNPQKDITRSTVGTLIVLLLGVIVTYIIVPGMNRRE